MVFVMEHFARSGSTGGTITIVVAFAISFISYIVALAVFTARAMQALA